MNTITFSIVSGLLGYTFLRDGTYAQRLGLQKGDIIVSINSKSIPTVAALKQVVGGSSSSWSLSIKRGGQVMSVTVRG